MKRRLRRIVSWLCVLTLCLGLLPTTALAATAEGNDSLVTLDANVNSKCEKNIKKYI